MRLRVGLSLSLLFVCLAAVPAAARPVLIELRAADGASLGRLVGERDDRVTQVPLADVARLVGGTLRARGDRATLSVGGKRLEVRRERAHALVSGRPLELSAPVRVRQGVWLVPGDVLVRALPALLGKGVQVTVRAAPLAARPPVRPVVAVNAPARRPSAPVVPPPSAPERLPAESAAPPSVPPDEGPNTGPRGSLKAGAIELRYRSYPGFTRVVLEGESRFEPRLVETSGALLVPLAGLRTPAPRAVRAVRDGLIATLELGEVRGGTALRVAYERTPAGRKVYRLQDPPRLVLDFHRGTAGPAPVVTRPGALQTVVIDAGHGGQDPGAVGPKGLQEKDLTLDVSRRLAAVLQDEHGVKAILTRTRDTFLTLRERTAAANRHKADLFLSIHVNAARGATASGTETYFLSSEATDNAARAAAAFENRVIELEPGPPTAARDVLRSILWDLAQSEFQQASSRLAEDLQDTLERALRLPNRGVKQAPFYVLGGAAMPAVLVEIGFISNPQEEERLQDEGYRDRIARALAAGVAAYKRRYDQKGGPMATR
jgi:N-acetylmuramoyl-L-alanine amidase